MKKSELNDIIRRKKILKESLDIIKESKHSMDELGGFDTPELKTQFHGNYYDELANMFFQMDGMIPDIIENFSKVIDEEGNEEGREVMHNFGVFMMSFHDFLQNIRSKTKVTISGEKYRPSLDDKIGLNEEDI